MFKIWIDDGTVEGALDGRVEGARDGMEVEGLRVESARDGIEVEGLRVEGVGDGMEVEGFRVEGSIKKSILFIFLIYCYLMPSKNAYRYKISYTHSSKNPLKSILVISNIL